MPKFIKKVTAQRCPVHQAILEECGRQLTDNGYFNKSEILDKTRFTAMEDSIRWDYIADFLSDPTGDHNIQIVPVAPVFFKSDKKDTSNVGRFLAGGHGKKTAGYVSATFNGGVLAVKRLENYRSMRNGVGKAFDNYLHRLEEQKFLPDEDLARLKVVK